MPGAGSPLASVHLVCGATGAGKSTYAEALARRIGGVRFSIDEWIGRLYLPDQNVDKDFAWFLERVERCCAQMREVAGRMCPLGPPAVFDCGFTTRDERGKFAEWADARGLAVQLHVVDADPATRWARVIERNERRGETYVLHVTREMFDFMEDLWEPPDDHEMSARDGVRV